jgi:hypothetical protein
MKRLRHLLALSLLSAPAFGLCGCTQTTVDRPVTVTTKPLPELSKATGRPVTGSSCGRVVLLIIPVGFATAESAYAEALGQSPGADALLNYEERRTHVFALPFYYQVCTVVHGYAVSSKTLTAEGAGSPAP